MQQIRQIWSAMPVRQRVIVGVATLLVFALVLGVTRLASKPSMTLLYAGLDSAAAGDVISALEQRGSPFEVRGGAIYVTSAERDQLRMTLASEGLPANGASGYELLDGLTGFGTTAAMFDAAYWRAKEGELARTIVASANIQTARVHIGNGNTAPFQRNAQTTASISVMTTGAALAADQAQALRFLVASAVAGLSPEDVVVIDGRNGVIGGTSGDDIGVEDTQETAMREGVQRLLEARVGPGNAVVELRIERISQTESILERRVDPDSRVLIQSETEENISQSQNGASDVSVASNLPVGDSETGTGGTSNSSQSRESVNYDLSEVQREVVRQAGGIARVTVAVLVNGVAEGDSFAPRSDEELAALEQLVASAVGFSADRGDQITLKSMVFEPVNVSGTEAAFHWVNLSSLDLLTLLQMAILTVVALALLIFVVRPVLSRPAPSPLPQIASPALSGEVLEAAAEGAANGSNPASETSAQTSDADPVQRLRGLISERQEDTVEILRSWLEDRPEQRG